MNAIDKAREDRSRNLARLRKLTIGTAALGVAATTGFGYLAAMTYSGSTTSDTTAAITTTAATTSLTSSSPASAGTTTTNTTSTTSSRTSTAPTVTSVSGGANASTGGS